jgi:U3 small nucleolar RNA-associated protein 6
VCCQPTTEATKELLLIFSAPHQTNQVTMAEAVNRPQKRSRLEGKATTEIIGPEIPHFDVSSSDFSPELFSNAFERFQAVHLSSLGLDDNGSDLTWEKLGSIYQLLSSKDQDSWCIETAGETAKPELLDFLKPETTDHVAYCSFLVQKDKKAYEDLVQRLPLKEFSWNSWGYEPCLWIFFGRNSSDKYLQGRTEHTDSVSHDGTWHYQLSGTKQWFLRPTAKLMEHMAEKLDTEELQQWNESTKLQVNCHQGDVIVVNTRLWYHQTIIPSQKLPSVSYARDFWVSRSEEKDGEDGGAMTNMDGLYANNDIVVGTLIFTENDMPDCELHRSTTNANCEVVELEDGTSAVVSSRAINAGEFFCVPESSDDEDESDDGEEEEEEISDDGFSD